MLTMSYSIRLPDQVKLSVAKQLAQVCGLRNIEIRAAWREHASKENRPFAAAAIARFDKIGKDDPAGQSS
jgi:hypothetical protein